MSYIGNLPTNVAFVTDQFNGDGSTVAFTMSVAPASTSSILVAITGVLQDPSTYAVSGTTLTFSAAPPSGTANISVRYLGIPASGITTTAYRTVTEFTATAGQTTFSVPSYTVGYIDVYRNGSRLGSDDYTADDGTTVELVDACTAGDLVVTESFYVSSVLNAIPATAGAVNSTYITDDAVTTDKIADAAVTQAKLAAGVAGNGPAFSAYKTGNQSVTSGVTTKVTYDAESFDTNACFDLANSKFIPNVAGYYQISATFYLGSTAAGSAGNAFIYKNGSEQFRTQLRYTSANANAYATQNVQGIVYLNGSTDYVEAYANIVATGSYFGTIGEFSGCLVRAA